MDFAELSRRLEALLRGEGGKPPLGPARLEHSLGVAALAAELCLRRGLDPERGRAAGLAHDLCKELPREAQRALASARAGASPSSARLVDKAVHGHAAAALLERDFGVDDEELLDAVSCHTFGRPDMGLLATLLYCADKLEPGRRRVDPAFRERCLGLPPGEMLREVAENLVGRLASDGLPIAPETARLLESLKGRVPTP